MTKKLFFLLKLCAGLLIAIPSFATEWPSERIVENLQQEVSANKLKNTPFQNWITLNSLLTKVPVIAYGTPVNLSAKNTLDILTQVYKIADDFEFFHENSVKGIQRVFYQELRDNLPILSSRAEFVLNQKQLLMRWGFKSFSDYSTIAKHNLSIYSAHSLLTEKLESADWKLNENLSITAWFPDIDLKILRPVYWIHTEGTLPHQKWEAIVDANTGEIILDWPGINTDIISGTIQGQFWPEYDIDSIQVGVHAFESVSINSNLDTTNLQGQFSRETQATSTVECYLHGPYVEVTNEDGPVSALSQTFFAPYFPFTMNWTIANATRPELNLFYHTSFIHQWYKALDPAFNALDYALPAVANVGTGYDNAYWNGYGTYYGSGSQYHNFAMFSDVIYHEYTHGVTDGIYPPNTLPYTGQPGAMNEAWSDYFACTINGDALMAEWIDGNPLSNFRNLNNHLVFPRNWVGEVHGDSPFISGSLWDIRTAMGAEFTDPLGHFARYGLAETFFDYLVAVLETDDDDGDLSNGTPNSEVIYQSFYNHGIGPGSNPQFAISNLVYFANGQGQSLGNGNRFMESGERAQCEFRLENTALLFPPPATDVQIFVTTNDPAITIQNGTQTVSTISAGSYYQMNPILMQISPQAVDHWAVVDIHVLSNNGTVSYDTSFEFTIGLPHILIVKDDPNTPVENFVTSSMRSQDEIYDLYELSNQESLPEDRYPTQGLVIWLSGNAGGQILTTQDQFRLQAYLAAGNRIVLSGQNIVDNLAGGSFLQNTCQVEIASDSISSGAATANGFPFNNGEWFLLAGADGAGNQYQKTAFAPFGNSQSVGYYGRGASGPSAIVTFANQHGLLFGFGIEAISGMGNGDTDRSEFLNRLYAWANDVLGVEENTNSVSLPAVYALSQAYPNPFNSTVTLEYSVPMESQAQLLIYDLLGRTIESLAVNSTQTKLSWTPKVASGIYFAKLQWTNGQSKPVKLVLLK